MNRAEYQQLAGAHLQHAKALLDVGLYAGSYYIAGYVVECALKACVAKLFSLTVDYEFPEQGKHGAAKGGG